MRRILALSVLIGGGLLSAACARDDAEAMQQTGEGTVELAQAGTVAFHIDARIRRPISPYIYGMNFAEQGANASGAGPWHGARIPAGVTLNRFGGNRLSTFNWETGWSNVASDGDFSNDAHLLRRDGAYDYGTVVGAAVAGRVDSSFARGQGIILTIPMLGYVAGDADGAALGTTDRDRADRLRSHFLTSRAFKGAPLSLTPSVSDDAVFQDEFVHWVNARWPGHAVDRQRPIFFALDNEPDLWTSTHKEIQSDSGDDARRPRLLTYDQLADRSIEYASAVKSQMPDALVFAPGVATYAGIVSGGRYTDGWHDDPVHGRANFLDVYLDRMRRAEKLHGRRLLDVLDVHYYPASGDGGAEVIADRATQSDAMVRARLQAPRSLWDSQYVEGSWVNSVTGGPIALLPRLRAQVAAHYPGTRLAVTEYYFGRAGDISGGLAQADVLGVFGREGVFAANLWPYANVAATPYDGDGSRAYAYAFGAFDLYLDADGARARFGDTGLAATTTDREGSSVYASVDGRGRTIIVAINKRSAPVPASIAIAGAAFGRVTSLRRMMEGIPTPAAMPTTELVIESRERARYLMPPLSATVMVIAP